MASLLPVGTAVPPHLMPQAEAQRIAEDHFAEHIPDVARYLRVFRSALVKERHFCVESDWFRVPHSLAEKNALYLEWAERLARSAIEKCLAENKVAPDEIDHFIFVSSSGIATPSLDVAIINALGLPAGVRRVPLFGLGCAGGAAGIALASGLAAGSPGACILLVAVEINSLTFQPDDFSKSNLVATSLFGDGAAATLIRSTGKGPVNLLKCATTLRPGTEKLMGWDFGDSGFRVVFSRDVPDVIGDMMPEAVAKALAGRNITIDQVRSFAFHPGGKRILATYEKVLGRPPAEFRASYDVLARYGNMSSATVLFVLDEEMRNSPHRSGDYGLLAAFGPGFSAEVTLMQWA